MPILDVRDPFAEPYQKGFGRHVPLLFQSCYQKLPISYDSVKCKDWLWERFCQIHIFPSNWLKTHRDFPIRLSVSWAYYFSLSFFALLGVVTSFPFASISVFDVRTILCSILFDVYRLRLFIPVQYPTKLFNEPLSQPINPFRFLSLRSLHRCFSIHDNDNDEELFFMLCLVIPAQGESVCMLLA